MTQIDNETRTQLRKLSRVIEEFRKLDPRMELGQIIVLLQVLNEPGMWAKDLAAKAGLGRSATSRSVKALSTLSYLLGEDGKPRAGLDLITQIPDAIDQRAYQLAPTRKGWAFAERIANIIKE